jgi:sn-glycerol 3-phosphate transport system substrate-binding protein
MLSFPYNSSSPILYYNKDIFKKAGLDENNPPKTWNEVWDAAKKIKSSGAAPCGFTSTWLTWIHTENFAAWNNYQWGTQENGIAGPNVELKINAKPFVDHFQALADLARTARSNMAAAPPRPSQIFLAGECGLFTESSGGLGDIIKSGMNYGTGMLPSDGETQNTIPGGASLWVFAGKSTGIQGRRGVLQFPVADRHSGRLHQVSGYLPVTLAAYEKSKASTGSTKRTRRARSDQADAGRAYRELQGRSPA